MLTLHYLNVDFNYSVLLCIHFIYTLHYLNFDFNYSVLLCIHYTI